MPNTSEGISNHWSRIAKYCSLVQIPIKDIFPLKVNIFFVSIHQFIENLHMIQAGRDNNRQSLDWAFAKRKNMSSLEQHYAEFEDDHLPIIGKLDGLQNVIKPVVLAKNQTWTK